MTNRRLDAISSRNSLVSSSPSHLEASPSLRGDVPGSRLVGRLRAGPPSTDLDSIPASSLPDCAGTAMNLLCPRCVPPAKSENCGEHTGWCSSGVAGRAEEDYCGDVGAPAVLAVHPHLLTVPQIDGSAMQCQ